MNSLWSITPDDYFEIVKRSKEAGLKPGDDMTPIFLKYMEEKGKKPIGNTELTKNEMISEYLSHDKKVLDISVDEKGKSNYKIYKKDNDNDNKE